MSRIGPTLRLKNSFSQITCTSGLPVQIAATSALRPTAWSIQSGRTLRIPWNSAPREASVVRDSIGRCSAAK